MNLKPILFKPPMVQAILNGTKTQTRRLIKPQPNENGIDYIPNPPSLDWEQTYNDIWKPWSYETEEGESVAKFCPYGEKGDVLWVRETFSEEDISFWEGLDFIEKYRYEYKADNEHRKIKWKPGIHMPKEACRLFLEVTRVCVQRLQDITEEDAKAEGVLNMFAHDPSIGSVAYMDYMDKKGGWDSVADDARHSFQTLWQSINGVESWDANPWVWVVRFKRIDKVQPIPDELLKREYPKL